MGSRYYSSQREIFIVLLCVGMDEFQFRYWSGHQHNAWFGNPKFKWIDEGQVISYNSGGEGVNVIDPLVLKDADETLGLFYGSYKAGLRLAELNSLTDKLLKDHP